MDTGDVLVKTLEGRLRAREMQLRELVQQHRDRLGEPGSARAGAALDDPLRGRDDAVDGDDEREILLLRRAQVELDEVLCALQRVERGVYGMCAACREAIEVHRLRVMPEARLCTECQRSFERRARDRAVPIVHASLQAPDMPSAKRLLDTAQEDPL